MNAVLIVDDESLIRWSLAESLESADCRVLEAASAREALDLVARQPNDISVILLDLRLPDSNDLSLLRRIRQISPRSRVILMTAYGSPEILAEALTAGASNVLSKPFDMGNVVGLIRDAGAPPAAALRPI